MKLFRIIEATSYDRRERVAMMPTGYVPPKMLSSESSS